jgi:hypothetical protein
MQETTNRGSVMKQPPLRPLALAALLALSAPVAAATYSWFDEPPVTSDTPTRWSPRYAAFSVDLLPAADVAGFPGDTAYDSGVLRLSGGFEREPWRVMAPHFLETREEAVPAPRLRALSLAWQHRLDAESFVTFSAGYSSPASLFTGVPELADTRAGMSLTSRWAGDYGPRLTGSVFVGGESGTAETYRLLGRRYYGFAIGGELTLFKAHTPYISFQAQRAYAGGGDEVLPGIFPDDERSQFAAGWKWQAKPHLSLQAEASYGYNGNRLRLRGPERSRVFFGTRFDFK